MAIEMADSSPPYVVVTPPLRPREQLPCGRLRDANTKETLPQLRATKLSAPSGVRASSITKLSNRIHSEVLHDESHVACLEALKDEFGLRVRE